MQLFYSIEFHENVTILFYPNTSHTKTFLVSSAIASQP